MSALSGPHTKIGPEGSFIESATLEGPCELLETRDLSMLKCNASVAVVCSEKNPRRSRRAIALH
jgi:hypothetical protein